MSISQRTGLLALATLSALALAQNAWYWSQLPNRVAIHFGANGVPDNWMDKSSATLLMCSFQIGLPLFLVGITWIAAFLPSALINVPNRKYWLHPDRRVKALEYVNCVVAWIAVLASLFMMLVGHLTFIASQRGDNLRTDWLGYALTLYLLIMFALVGGSFWRFRLPREAVR
jgi:uncharacterized membrane protein